MNRSIWSIALAVILALGSSCGDDSPGGCEGLCNTLCQMATDCVTSATQSDVYFKATAADGSSVVQGRNPAGRGCELGMVRDVCGDPTNPAELFAACEAALGEASCGLDGTDEVLVLPAACQGLLDCNAGPCLD